MNAIRSSQRSASLQLMRSGRSYSALSSHGKETSRPKTGKQTFSTTVLISILILISPNSTHRRRPQPAVDAHAPVPGRVRRRPRQDGRDPRPAFVRAPEQDGRGYADAGRALLRGLQGVPRELPGRRRREPVPRRPRSDRLPSHRVSCFDSNDRRTRNNSLAHTCFTDAGTTTRPCTRP